METMKKVTLQGIEAALPVDIVTDDGVGLIKHDVIENFLTKIPRIDVNYKAIFVNPPNAVIECRMTDTQTKHTVTKVGETNLSTLTTDISRNFGVTMAYQRAYNRAAIALLGLNEGGHIYSDLEVSRKDLERRNNKDSFQKKQEIPEPVAEVPVTTPVAEAKPETPAYTMTDETVILIGGQKGSKLGEIKETKKFRSFLEWVKNPNTVMSFNDDEQRKQFEFLRAANI